MLGCAGFVDFVEELKLKLGVPVLDGVMPAVKFAEALVDMNLKTSKVNTWAYPPEDKEFEGYDIKLKKNKKLIIKRKGEKILCQIMVC